jgi:hypothetical protein
MQAIFHDFIRESFKRAIGKPFGLGAVGTRNRRPFKKKRVRYMRSRSTVSLESGTRTRLLLLIICLERESPFGGPFPEKILPDVQWPIGRFQMGPVEKLHLGIVAEGVRR